MLLWLSLVLHYSVFLVIGRYDQGNTNIRFLLSIQSYVFGFIAHLVMTLFYGAYYLHWKAFLRRSFGIIHGNVVLYYFLHRGLALSHETSLILVGGSIVLFFFAFSRLRYRWYWMMGVLTLMVLLLLLETIPVYRKTVSPHVFFEQQPVSIAAHINDRTQNQAVVISSNQAIRRYSLNEIATTPLTLSRPLDNIQYISPSWESDNIVSITLWNGDILFLLPQTSLTWTETRHYDNIFVSRNTVEIHNGNIGRWTPHSGSLIINHDWLSQQYHSGQLIWGVFTWQNKTQQAIASHVFSRYQDDVRDFTRRYYHRTFSSSPVIERISYFKMLLYQLVYSDYSMYLDNFLAYRYWGFGDNIPGGHDALYVPMRKIEQTATRQYEEVDANQLLNSGAIIALPRTRIFGQWFP